VIKIDQFKKQSRSVMDRITSRKMVNVSHELGVYIDLKSYLAMSRTTSVGAEGRDILLAGPGEWSATMQSALL